MLLVGLFQWFLEQKLEKKCSSLEHKLYWTLGLAFPEDALKLLKNEKTIYEMQKASNWTE